MLTGRSSWIPAPGFKIKEHTMSVPLRDKADCEDGEKVSNDISEEKMKVHRGERYLHDIQVETMQGKSSCGKIMPIMTQT